MKFRGTFELESTMGKNQTVEILDRNNLELKL